MTIRIDFDYIFQLFQSYIGSSINISTINFPNHDFRTTCTPTIDDLNLSTNDCTKKTRK